MWRDAATTLSPDQLRGHINSVRISPVVAQELHHAVRSLSAKRLAVRSSALDEDGQQQSFAGQLESVLGVPSDSLEAVEAAVLTVWKSAWGDRLLTYRQEHGLMGWPEPPAVILQVMLEATISGVAFSADPLTGQWAIALVSAVYGLGTGLVSGDREADTYRVDRQGSIIQRQIAPKMMADYFDPQCGIRSVSLAPHQQSQPCLSDAQVVAIATLARQTAQRLGRPQDIEWAIARDQLYLLQSRPITTLAKRGDPDGIRTIWDNSNISESYSGVTTPLTFSFARRAYEEVYRQFCRLMGVSNGAIAQHSATFRCMIGLIQGRIYYNLLNWYRVLALLPGFRVNRRFMEQMMGVKEPLPDDVLASLAASTWGDRLRDGLSLARTIAGLVWNGFTLRSRIRQFYQRLDQALSLPDARLTELRPDELITYYLTVERQLITRWDAPLVNDFFAMIFYGLLRQMTQTWGGDRTGTAHHALLSQTSGIISAEPAHQIRHLATLANPHPDLVMQLCQGSLDELEAFMPRYPAFLTGYHAYLVQFGDRCLDELKLESPTLHDNPLLLLRTIGQLAQAVPSIPEEASHAPEGLIDPLPAVLPRNPLKAWVFQWVLSLARARVRDRENLRFERTRLFGRARRVFLELGKRFTALAILQQPDDVFYLEVGEILAFVEGTATCTDFQGLVGLRRAEFDRYRQLPPPADRFETQGMVYQGNDFRGRSPQVPMQSGSVRQGTGCAPGRVRAPVQVITDPHQITLKPGHILVAERTDPGWILFFPAAAGLLVERGSVLSHVAIVARELGLPTILSLPGITQWLQDGDWVVMDGSTGQVERIPVPVFDPLPQTAES
jgi:pyruvate,water dikinase